MDFRTGMNVANFIILVALCISGYGLIAITKKVKHVALPILYILLGALVYGLYLQLGNDILFWALFAGTLISVSAAGDEDREAVLSPLQVFTVGVFLAVYAYQLPVCMKGGLLTGALRYAEALHRTLRVFVVDIDFKDVVDVLGTEAESLAREYQQMGALLYVLAPVLLFGNLLTLFENLFNEMRFYYPTYRPYYVFSELNAKSIALAEDICKKPPKTYFPLLSKWLFPPVIVFTEVYSQNREKEQELLLRAKALRAICIKRDVAKLDYRGKWSRVEIFLIGEKEEENVSQAMTIMGKLAAWKKKNVQLYVFSRKESDGCILDSVDYGRLNDHLNRKMRWSMLLERIRRKWYGRERQQELMLKDRYRFSLYDGKNFSLRRVDVVQHLIWSIVPQMRLLSRVDDEDKTLSVLIAGFGSYGQEFFKMLLWFCQFEGLQLKLTVVDREQTAVVRSIIDRHCPEILELNRDSRNGEAHYDIEILGGVDMRGGEFEKLLTGPNGIARRLQQTDLAFVSMGDDDLNVETALYLRTLTDRVRKPTEKQRAQVQTEPVQIYAVVFDEVKSKLLKADEKDPAGKAEKGFFLQDHKQNKYHIYFVGGLKEQFSYDRITWQKLEQDAYYHHRSWEEISARIAREKEEKKKAEAASAGEELQQESAVQEQPQQETARQTEPEKLSPEERLRRDIRAWMMRQPWIQKLVEQYRRDEKERKEKLNYHKFEYYRNSSIAKAVYYDAVRQELGALVECDKNLQTCECENCVRRKKSEHMRWNAYMRVTGWRYGQRSDRAKLHSDLIPWSRLEKDDRDKD